MDGLGVYFGLFTIKAEGGATEASAVEVGLGLPLMASTTTLGRVAQPRGELLALTAQASAVSGLGFGLAQDAGKLDMTCSRSSGLDCCLLVHGDLCWVTDTGNPM